MENAEQILIKCKQRGFEYIKQMIIDQQEENIFLTFQCKTDCTSGDLSNLDKKIYIESVLFFSRVAGGVIIWGISPQKNPDGTCIAGELQPIFKGEMFLNNLNSIFFKGHTNLNIDNVYIPFSKENNTGFVITYISRGSYLFNLNNYYTKTQGNCIKRMGEHSLTELLNNKML